MTRWERAGVLLLLALAVWALWHLAASARQMADDYRDLNVETDTLPAAWVPRIA